MTATTHATYVLRVKGDSMLADQVRDGDNLIVTNRTEPEDGETVLVNVDGVVLLRRWNTALVESHGFVRLFRLEGQTVPRVVDPAAVVVQGVVVGLIRNYRKGTPCG